MPASDKRILIIGAGPVGLGAANRLASLGHTEWEIVEATDHVGGLASTITDEQGFLWDIGVHVNFSHYEHYDRLMQSLPIDWLQHIRASWVWTKDRFIPFAFQNNIRHLPREAMWECLQGIISEQRRGPRAEKARDFREWILRMFGPGIAKHFMFPYNLKIWAHPLEDMNASWVGDRVTPTDLERVVKNILEEKDDLGWGPNSTFRFPRQGGTGAVWKAVAATFPREKITFKTRLVKLETVAKVAHFDDGSRRPYDCLLSALPLDRLVALSDMPELERHTEDLVHSALHVVGIGLKKPVTPSLTQGISWIYFPDDNCPYYRATIFSNLSPEVVPNPESQWSILTETAESAHRPVNRDTIVDEVIQGLINTKMIQGKEQVIDRFHLRVEHGYPTPTLGRDAALRAIQSRLMERDVYSRGRFGGWKYEVGNQDHSVMQGVEAVDRMLFGVEEQTLWQPDVVNAPRAWQAKA